MNSSVRNQLDQGQPSDLPADRIETGKNNRFRGIVNDQIDPVAASIARIFLPSRPMIRPFISSPGKLDDRNRSFGNKITGISLNGGGYDFFGLFIRLFFGFVFDPFDQFRTFVAGLIFHGTNQQFLGLIGGQRRNFFQLRFLFGQQRIVFFFCCEKRLSRSERLFSIATISFSR
jgi:hypothetical protein